MGRTLHAVAVIVVVVVVGSMLASMRVNRNNLLMLSFGDHLAMMLLEEQIIFLLKT